MDTELKTIHPEEETACVCSCAENEEISICNCENDETVTVYEAEDADLTQEQAEETNKEKLLRKCNEVKAACRTTAERLAEDWKQSNGNPYIKQTRSYQVDIYRNPEDETPIDTFRTEKSKSYSARTAAAIGGVALIMMCTAECLIKKLTGKD